MSAEHRENRPFSPVPQLDVLLEAVKLHVGDTVVLPDTTTVVSDDVFLRSPFILRLSQDENQLNEAIEKLLPALEEGQYRPDDLSLVVLASSAYLKIFEPLNIIPLPDLVDVPASLHLTSPLRPKAMRSPRSGCEIDVAVCLNRALDFRPLQAWRRWTWLSKIRFGVETEASLGGFVALPLDTAKRQEFGLPSGTMRYVLIDSEVSVASSDCSEDSVQLYVDADLLALMGANDRSSNSALLQRIIFIDAVASVVREAARLEDIADLTIEDIRGSLLAKVIRMAAGPAATPTELAAMLNLLRERPAAFMARIEHAAGLLAGAQDVVGGTQ